MGVGGRKGSSSEGTSQRNVRRGRGAFVQDVPTMKAARSRQGRRRKREKGERERERPHGNNKAEAVLRLKQFRRWGTDNTGERATVCVSIVSVSPERKPGVREKQASGPSTAND